MKAESKLPALLSIFTSSGTLICCALPALLVTLGLGATLGSLVTLFPQLRWLTLHKVEIFSIAAVMLAVAGVFQYRARYAPCPIDPVLAKSCMRARKISLALYVVSLAIYAVGFFFAFLAVRFL